MSDIRISGEVQEIMNFDYFNSYDLTAGKDGFLIESNFSNSSEFKEALVEILIEYYKSELKQYLIANESFYLNTIGINNILNYINDITLIKKISKKVDGKIFTFDMPHLDGNKWRDWVKEKFNNGEFIINKIIFVHVN